MTETLAFFAAGIAGWLAAALFGGLWWGERARRKDALTREGIIPAYKPRAIVSEPKPGSSLEHEEGPGHIDEVRERMIRDCMAEGHSRKACEEDIDRMLGRLSTGVDDRSAGW